jgi:nitrogen fixation protein FixH
MKEPFPMSCCGVFIMPFESTGEQVLSAREARPITGRFVLITFIAFFGVIAAVNAVMMTLAIRTMPGLDVKNGYVASQAMNREIDAMRLQTGRGWKADITVQLKNRQAPVSISLTEPDGSPVTGLAMTARLAHPALTRADHSAALIERRPGVYSADLSDVHAGAWTLVVEADRNGERVFASRNRLALTEARP